MESDNLLIIALRQLDAISAEVQNMNQLKADDFIRAVIKISQKVATAKGIENANIPSTLSRDMNQKYRECQKLVEFIKTTGYKTPINLNNLLFPTIKEMNTILEYLVEMLSREDQQHDSAEYTEKNFSQIKQTKKLRDFISESWILPEINPNTLISQSGNNSKSLVTVPLSNRQKLLIFDKNSLKLIKRKAQGCELDDRLKKISQEKTQLLYENSKLSQLLTNEDYEVSGDSMRIYSKIQEITKENRSVENTIKNIKDISKGTQNQNWIEVFNIRNQGVIFHKENFYENNFTSKVKLLRDRQTRYENYVKDIESDNTFNITNSTTISISNNLNTSTSIYSQDQNLKTINNELETTLGDIKKDNEVTNTGKDKETKIQASITTMQINFEKEKTELISEINDLNNKLEALNSNINDKQEEKEKLEENIEEKSEILRELNKKNQSVLNTIEAKLEALENLDKLKKNQIKEEELDQELKSLEEKHTEMINGWNQYSNQINFQLNEVKEEVETKKKQYSYKYDKINQLKKEIEEMATKTAQKAELKNFLKDEFEKIPLEVNRNKYISKICDLTNSLSNEKEKWGKYLKEIKLIEEQLEQSVDIIKRIDNELEDKLFQDAKTSSSLKDGYTYFIKIRENYNIIQKNMIDTQILKDKIRETENKVEDYRIKLKNYDLKQLEEQVEGLKKENFKERS